jgi:hypothetical protein
MECTRKTAADFWGMPDNRVKYLVEYKKIITPAKPGIGQGKVSIFDDTNLVEIGIAERLGRYGMAIGAIEKVFKLLRHEVPPENELPKDLEQERESILNRWRQFDELYLFIYGTSKKNQFIKWTHPRIDFFITEAAGKAAMKYSNSVLIIDLGAIFRKVKNG